MSTSVETYRSLLATLASADAGRPVANALAQVDPAAQRELLALGVGAVTSVAEARSKLSERIAAYTTRYSAKAVRDAAAPHALAALATTVAAPAARPGSASLDLDEALAALRALGFAAAAGVVDRRVTQDKPKMKLTPEQGRDTARALVERLPTMPAARALLEVMPKSAVELVRATNERGLPAEDAEALATYLARLVGTLRPANVLQLDENHSHVIGRRWHEIDYSGEKLNWQTQRDHWSKLGVQDFRTAEHVHRYFSKEESLSYFARIYKPQGRMTDVAAP